MLKGTGVHRLGRKGRTLMFQEKRGGRRLLTMFLITCNVQQTCFYIFVSWMSTFSFFFFFSCFCELQCLLVSACYWSWKMISVDPTQKYPASPMGRALYFCFVYLLWLLIFLVNLSTHLHRLLMYLQSPSPQLTQHYHLVPTNEVPTTTDSLTHSLTNIICIYIRIKLRTRSDNWPNLSHVFA